MALRTSRPARRTVPALALLAISTFFITGCDPDAYSEDMTYPLRSDPLIVSVPTNASPIAPDPPGTLDKMPARIKELGGKILDPKDLSGLKDDKRKELEKQLRELDKELAKLFGKPAAPKVDGKVGDSEEDIAEALKLSSGKGLAAGSKLFRHHCLHCHGLTGDGHGPTAEWVNPHPRDYRQGIFKFTSTNQGSGTRKARREDLKRTLEKGIEGTSMPSFGLLKEEELEELVSYVIHLSIRGEVEFKVMQKVLGDEPLEDDSAAAEATKQRDSIVARWVQAQDPKSLIKPDTSCPDLSDGFRFEKSVKNGHKLFIDPSGAGCVSCHKDFGRQNNYKFDSWGTIVRPIDFTRGVYRGGRRPIDLYWRIHSGINGANMASFNGPLNSEQMWDLVNFLQVLPYPEMRRKYGIEID
jgi:mono/diheme cytochrome c family protein